MIKSILKTAGQVNKNRGNKRVPYGLSKYLKYLKNDSLNDQCSVQSCSSLVYELKPVVTLPSVQSHHPPSPFLCC